MGEMVTATIALLFMTGFLGILIYMEILIRRIHKMSNIGRKRAGFRAEIRMLKKGKDDYGGEARILIDRLLFCDRYLLAGSAVLLLILYVCGNLLA